MFWLDDTLLSSRARVLTLCIITPGISLDILVPWVAPCGDELVLMGYGDEFILVLTGYVTYVFTACSQGIYLC